MAATTITLAINVFTAERATSTHKSVKIINIVVVLTTIDIMMQIVISISIVCVGCTIICLMPLLRAMTIYHYQYSCNAQHVNGLHHNVKC